MKTSDGLVYFKAHGQFTYGKVPPYPPSTPDVQTNTLFDLASLTKVMPRRSGCDIERLRNLRPQVTATTTAVAQFYERCVAALLSSAHTCSLEHHSTITGESLIWTWKSLMSICWAQSMLKMARDP